MATPLNPKRTHAGMRMKDRTPAARLAASTITRDDFTNVALSTQRRVKLLAASTETTHKRIIKNFKAAMEYQIENFETNNTLNSYLDTCSGKPASIEAMFHDGAPFPNKNQIESYLLFRATTGVGRVNESISITTIKHEIWGFFSAFRRKTGSAGGKDALEQALAYVDGELMQKVGLVRGRTFRPIPDGKVIFVIMEQVFSPDFKVACKRTRIQILAFIGLLMSSACRSGSIVRSISKKNLEECLLWKDCKFIITPNEVDPSGPNHLIVSVTTEFGKTKTVEGRGFGVFESSEPLRNAAMMMLTLAMQDEIFEEFSTIEEVFSPRLFAGVNEGKEMLTLGIKDDMNNIPVFRQTIVEEGKYVISPSISATTTQMHAHLAKLSHLAGIEVTVGPHSIRRMCVAAMMGTGARTIEIQRDLSHNIGSKLLTRYMSLFNQMDVAALVFGNEQRSSLIKKLDLTRLQTDIHAPIQISPANRKKIFEHKDVKEPMEAQIALLIIALRDYGGLKNAPEAMQEKFKDLYKEGRSAYTFHHRSFVRQERAEYYAKNIRAKRSTLAVASTDTARNPDVFTASEAGGVAGDDFGSEEADGLVDAMPEDGTSFFGSLNEFQQVVGDRDFTDSQQALAFIPHSDQVIASADPQMFQSLQSAANISGVTIAGDDQDIDTEDQAAPIAVAPTTAAPQIAEGASGGRRRTLPAARSRHSNIAVPAADVVSAADAVAPTPLETVASNPMDEFRTALARNTADRVTIFTMLRNLPDNEFSNTGFFPGLQPLADHRCVTCDMDLNQFTGTKSHDVKVKKVLHSLRCAQDQARADELPGLQEIYNPAASSAFQCFFCKDNDNAVAPHLYKTPFQQAQHMERHLKEEDSLVCSCGVTIAPERMALRMHMAREHQVWLCWRPATKGLRTIEAAHFADLTVPFDLENGAYGDPVKWDMRCDELVQRFDDISRCDTLLGPYQPRDDVVWQDFDDDNDDNDDNIEDMAATTGKANQDFKYYPVAAGTDLAMLQYGTCYWCYHDTQMPSSSRIHTHAVKGYISHCLYHVRSLIENTRVDVTVDFDGSNDDATHNGGPVYSYTSTTHSCLDKCCSTHGVAQNVTLLDFVNHLIQIHRITIKARAKTHKGPLDLKAVLYANVEELVQDIEKRTQARASGTGSKTVVEREDAEIPTTTSRMRPRKARASTSRGKQVAARKEKASIRGVPTRIMGPPRGQMRRSKTDPANIIVISDDDEDDEDEGGLAAERAELEGTGTEEVVPYVPTSDDDDDEDDGDVDISRYQPLKKPSNVSAGIFELIDDVAGTTSRDPSVSRLGLSERLVPFPPGSRPLFTPRIPLVGGSGKQAEPSSVAREQAWAASATARQRQVSPEGPPPSPPLLSRFHPALPHASTSTHQSASGSRPKPRKITPRSPNVAAAASTTAPSLLTRKVIPPTDTPISPSRARYQPAMPTSPARAVVAAWTRPKPRPLLPRGPDLSPRAPLPRRRPLPMSSFMVDDDEEEDDDDEYEDSHSRKRARRS